MEQLHLSYHILTYQGQIVYGTSELCNLEANKVRINISQNDIVFIDTKILRQCVHLHKYTSFSHFALHSLFNLILQEDMYSTYL